MWKANAKGGGEEGVYRKKWKTVRGLLWSDINAIPCFSGLTINKIVVTNMHNQKYLMEDKVKDEDDDPLKDKRCFQSFIIYMFMYMY